MSTSIDSPPTPTTPASARALESQSIRPIVASVAICAPIVAGLIGPRMTPSVTMARKWPT